MSKKDILEMENQIVVNDLTIETVKELTESQIAKVLYSLDLQINKENRLQYMKIIDTAFEVRSVSAKSKDRQKDLEFFGYKFFPIQNNRNYVRGIRKKIIRKY